MIEDIFKKFGGRFSHTTTIDDRFVPTFIIIDNFDGEKFNLIIDSLSANYETIIENTLTEKIINKRDLKINSLINGN